MQDNHQILILGAGSFARSIADFAEEIPGNTVIGFVVNMPPFVKGAKLAGKPIFWIDELDDLNKEYLAICALGAMARLYLIQKVEDLGFRFTSLIHPSSYVSNTVKIGLGVIINSGAQIATDTNLGSHVIINRGALIGHNVTIKDYSIISPGVNIASNVCVGSKTSIGMGVNIIEHVNVGENCIIGAGSLLTKDVPDNVKVVGMPARIIERDIGDF